jgi:hypothetical protein
MVRKEEEMSERNKSYGYVIVVVRSGVINDVRFFRTYRSAIRNAKAEEDYNANDDSIVLAERGKGIVWCRETEENI